eukprot:5774235-Prymnesium_polylepis.1
MVKTAVSAAKNSKKRLMQREERYMAVSTENVDTHNEKLRRMAAVPNDVWEAHFRPAGAAVSDKEVTSGAMARDIVGP